MPIKRSLSKIQQEGGQQLREVRERTLGYIIAALSLVAGLAWNEAIKGILQSLFPIQQDSWQVKLVYALLITFMVVFASIYLTRLLKDEGKSTKE